MLALKKTTKCKVINVTPMAMKLGQKDVLPALSFRLEAVLSNHELEQLAPGLKAFLFTKPSTAPDDVKKRQQTELEGVEQVSDLPSLSIAGQRMGTFEWVEEQTGCTLTIDRGTGRKDSNITLDGCTYKKLQITPQEGGSFKARFTVNTSASEEIDDTTHGRLSKMKKREIHVTLEGPKVDQAPIAEEAGAPAGATPGATVTPLTALKGSVEREQQREPEAQAA